MGKKLDMRNWQCRVKHCSSVGKFNLIKIMDNGNYFTRCKICKTINVFDKQ